MKYEAPEIVELGTAEELILGCGCDGCDCSGGKTKAKSGAK
jgi:hypothetical protein